MQTIMRLKMCNTTIAEMEEFLKTLRMVGCNDDTVLWAKYVFDIEVLIE